MSIVKSLVIHLFALGLRFSISPGLLAFLSPNRPRALSFFLSSFAMSLAQCSAVHDQKEIKLENENRKDESEKEDPSR